MKNKLMLFLFFITTGLFANQYYSSDISYSHISGNTYGITIRIYSSDNISINDCQLAINYGDGNSSSIPRVNGPSILCTTEHDGVMINSTVLESIYYTTHTYPSSGNYIVNYQLINRPAGMCNMPNSISTDAFGQAEIVINPLLGNNTSPAYTTIPVEQDTVGILNYYNPSVNEPENDSLYYELIPAMSSGISISGYTLPDATNSFSIDHLTGTTTWDMPFSICQYYFDIKITEWRNIGGTQYYIGHTMQDVITYTNIYSGIENNDKEEYLSIYPNPTKNQLQINKDNSQTKINYSIYNVIGELLGQGTLIETTTILNTDNLESGVYFIKIDSSNGKAFKFVKE